MSKIAYFSIPAYGHTNPTLDTVRKLIERGNEVYYFSFENMKERIEETGAVFIPCNNREKIDRGEEKNIYESIKFLIDETLSMEDLILSKIDEIKPDCFVCDPLALWGKAVALKYGIPLVISNTTFLFNKNSDTVIQQTFKEKLDFIKNFKKAEKEVKRLTDKGYPFKTVVDIMENTTKAKTVVYTSPEFQPYSESYPPNVYFVGPSVIPPRSEFKKTRDKLIYLSMGTVKNDYMPLYTAAVEAFKDEDVQLVISCKGLKEKEEFKNLPENVEIYDFTDQTAVLEKADVFITHCGINSVSEALSYAVPLVMYPQTGEQKAVAARVKELGAGLYLEEVTPLGLRDAVEEVLVDEAFELLAEDIRDSFLLCDGAEKAADIILSSFE